MTTVDKLGISGIRSFEPQREVTIRFIKPLTIILGHNGAGKTTIIECIKMACTGDLPPFTDKGGAFVHDPKITSTTETKAKIRLQFTDTGGRKIVVNRQFQVTNKANKRQEFKTVEQSLQYTDANGEKQTVSHRCNDVNKSVPELMGVSKAILENVIFVHQEESLWPLADGKKLKEKFDDIFASTRYTKALDAIRKQRKEHQSIMRERKSELELWKDRMQRAKDLEEEHEALRAQESVFREEVADIEKQMRSVENDLKAVEGKVVKFDKLNEERRQLEAQLAAREETKQQIYSDLEDELEDDATELQKWMETATKKLSKLKESRAEKREEIIGIQRQIEAALKEQRELSTEQGRLQAEERIHAADEEELAALKADMRSDPLCTKITSELRERESAGKWAQALDQVRASLEKELQTQLGTDRSKQSSQDEELSKVRVQVSQLEEQIDKAHAAALHARKTSAAKREELRTSLGSEDPEELAAVERERANRTREALELARKNMAEDDSQRRSEEKQAELHELRRKLTALNEERKTYSFAEDARSRLQLLTEQADEKKKTMSIKESKVATLAEAIGVSREEMEAGDLADLVSRKMKDAETERRASERRLLEHQSSLRAKEAEKKMIEAREEELLAALNEADASLAGASRGQWDVNSRDSFDDVLSTLSTELDSALEEVGFVKYGGQFLETLVERGRSTNCCPTCDRGFEKAGDFEALMDKLQRKRDRASGSVVKEKEDSAKKLAAELEAMKELGPLWEEQRKMRGALEKEETNKNAVAASIREVQAKIKSQEMENELQPTLVADMEELRRLLQELVAARKEHERLQRDVVRESSRIENVEIGRTLSDVESELAECYEKSEKLSADLDKLQKQREARMREVSSMQESFRDQTERISSLEKEIKRRALLHSEAAELGAESRKLESEASAMAETLASAEVEAKSLEERNAKARDENAAREREKRAHLDGFTGRVNTFKGVCKRIANYETKLEDFNPQKLQQQFDAVELRLGELREKVSSLESVDSQEADKSLQFEHMLSNISQNLKYRKASEEVDQLKDGIHGLREQQEAVSGGQDIAAKQRKFEQQWNQLNSQRHSTLGKVEGFEHRLRSLAVDLEKANAKGSVAEHKRILIELKTVEIANKDLDTYHKALDHALMSYHNLKMTEINKVIKELWQSTYQGNDIDYIEIVSDANDMGEAEKAATTKRNYNYRVVMRRGDALLDMRGRCSAGQKVLACLIIRLALAESFALDCGILALDEPTTNLDRRNIERLSASLAEIISSRRKQANFQLILITHDEEFIELLGSREICDSYYLVYRDENGYSRLKQQDLITFG